MFESLTDRLSKSFGLFRGKRELTEENIQEGLKAVRAALLEADVHFQLAREFTDRVQERALGEGRLQGVVEHHLLDRPQLQLADLQARRRLGLTSSAATSSASTRWCWMGQGRR